MCGIIGLAKKSDSDEALSMLKRLEYRGYDSFGVATDSGFVHKEVGEIKPVESENCTLAIAHTRWATHGGVTRENAHPHADCSGNIFIVHNGIIDNYLELKETLQGHRFQGQTDSEVIAHFFEETLKTCSIREAVEKFFLTAKGEFAVILMIKGDKNLYAFKRGSPLSLGLLPDGNVLASDIYAFSDKTDKAIFFNEDEFAIVNERYYEFFRFDGRKLVPEKKDVTTVKWAGTVEKKYDHYMLKEIYEQPSAVKNLVNSLHNEQKDEVGKLVQMIRSARRVVFVASGTSYHASLLGVYFLNKAGIEAHTIIASEFHSFHLVDDKTLLIAISQSGETMDVIEALHGMKAKGAKIASFVNVPMSTIERMSNVTLNVSAGQEICVAATKSFTNQVVAMAYVASLFGSETENVIASIESAISLENEIKKIAKLLASHRDIYIIGRRFLYPIAREIALKIKEISYIHAEGMMGGELKHGTIALIEKGTPVIALINGPDIVSNVMEVKARGAHIISITSSEGIGDTLKINAKDELSFALAANVVGQLLTYYIALEKHLPIDKPRNLAKSVTVK